jgi:hypothetical protein
VAVDHQPFDGCTQLRAGTIMAAVRHRRPETRARRVTAALAGPSALVCALVVLVAWVSQGRPGPTPWVAAPPPVTAPPWATTSPAAPLPSPTVTTPARSLSADEVAHSSAARRARSRPVARHTVKPAPKPTPARTGETAARHQTPAGGLLGSILGLLGRILGHGRGGHLPGRR